jgi:hypothetical protein
MDDWRNTDDVVEVTRRPLADRFADFHAGNPDVYSELVSLARLARGRGLRRYGIGQLWEVLRWQRFMRTRDDNTRGAKLNNDYRSRYARLIMDHEPDLDGFFETRRLRAR